MTSTDTQKGASIALSNLEKYYGSQKAIHGISLDIQPGEFMTFLGPSGSGKTTTLNLIAGFEQPNGGSILVDGVDVGSLPPHKREMGVVFQNYALFPHLRVIDNVAFGLRERGMPQKDARLRALEALETVRMATFADRFPAQLSGGQQQRVALARALAFHPRVLLMDEPLGALDRQLRDEMQFELQRIHHEISCTVVIVTHDQEEALALSDRIAVFEAGRISQVGTGKELYTHPRTQFVARFLGESTQLEGIYMHKNDGPIVEVPGLADIHVSAGPDELSDSVVVVVRPEALHVLQPDGASSTDNAVAAHITETVYLGSSRKLRARLANGVEAIVREPAGEIGSARVGDDILLGWNKEDCSVVPVAEMGSAPSTATRPFPMVAGH